MKLSTDAKKTNVTEAQVNEQELPKKSITKPVTSSSLGDLAYY